MHHFPRLSVAHFGACSPDGPPVISFGWWSRVDRLNRGGDARMTCRSCPSPFNEEAGAERSLMRPGRQIAAQASQEADGNRLLNLCRELERALEEQLDKRKPAKSLCPKREATVWPSTPFLFSGQQPPRQQSCHLKDSCVSESCCPPTAPQ